VLSLLLRKRHLLEGLLVGIAAALLLGLGLDLIAPGELVSIDRENFLARGSFSKAWSGAWASRSSPCC